MLGSISEADDAVQETWLRLSRSDTTGVDNLGGWLTTVVAHVCLDMLRSRASRREESLGELTEPIASNEAGTDPEREALMADSVGLALLVVLDRLAPAEPLAFVLHDMFAVPFEQIATVVGRSPAAARQLASRARRRMQGRTRVPEVRTSQERRVVDAFLAAFRTGDLNGVLAVLDPEVVRHADHVAVPSAEAREIRGAAAVANEALTHADRAHIARTAVVDGSVGIVVAPRGRLLMVLRCAVKDEKIIAMDVIADPVRSRQLEVAVLDDEPAARWSPSSRHLHAKREKKGMTRIEGIDPQHASFLMRQMFKKFRKMLGRDLTPQKIQARVPRPFWFSILGGWLLGQQAKVPPRLRALVTLRTAVRVGCPFWIDANSAGGRMYGLNDEEIAAIRGGQSEGFVPAEVVLLRMADAMSDTPSNITDELYAELRSHFSEEQLMELAASAALENYRARFNRVFDVGSDGLYRKGLQFKLHRAA